jgi:hypothetical protein
VGSWTVNVYRFDADGRVRYRSLLPLFRPWKRYFPSCDDTRYINFVAVGWADNGKDLLVVAQKSPNITCKNDRDYELEGFQVDLQARKVVAQLSEAELLKAWANKLGSSFH